MKRCWTGVAAAVCVAVALLGEFGGIEGFGRSTGNAADSQETRDASTAQDARWTLNADGSISWVDFSAEKIPHKDHIEASGEQISTVLRYGVDENGAFALSRSVVWPMLRTIPNNTHASLTERFDVDPTRATTVGGETAKSEKVRKITLNGFLTVESSLDFAGTPVESTREIFPSTTLPVLCERDSYRNASDSTIVLTVPEYREVRETDAARGVAGSYTLIGEVRNPGEFALKPGETAVVDYTIQGFSTGKGESELAPDVAKEKAARAAFVREVWDNLVFESPEPILNAAFAFAKIRASESVYRTAGGLMHGPGGESYYAAIWANDQAEYVGPFFPFLGYKTGNESAFNAYKHFARFTNDAFKPIPSSIIAEGIDIWNGAGDRGDAAMIAYGAARYALVRADEAEARELWPLVAWCLEYCERKLNADGVVASDCDELENRFPAGDANLCTSTLYYDALISAGYLGRELGIDAATLDEYAARAKTLRENIDRHFGANVGGFETYRYYKGCDKLRSWICIPFVAGIDERAEGTIAALFSDRLWTKDGLLTQEGSETFWDRSTLYALRGVFAVGATEPALEHLRRYSTTRLLGEHVPYPIEAWPEGSQRHLSAESGLYCRIFAEGIFGIRPAGFSAFYATPRLPKDWNEMKLRNVRGFGRTFDLSVARGADGKSVVSVETRDGKKYAPITINENETILFDFNK